MSQSALIIAASLLMLFLYIAHKGKLAAYATALGVGLNAHAGQTASAPAHTPGSAH